ncbi:MAG TPA: thioredoxin-disulfide reductase [Chloroflexi bacterium]|nr:thioredoxin-disulfide reductase [Chloroflexota bacterium]
MFDFKVVGDSETQQGAKELYDVIIVGGGPAGLTTAIYTSRDGKDTLVLEREATGGLAATTEHIENYPGFPEGINGMELMEKFREQAERFGTEILEFEPVTQIKPLETGLFEVHTENDNSFRGKTVVIATGSRPKRLNVPGEETFYGRGVSYCATCDGPLFKNKDVVVVGAGNSGLQESIPMLEYVKSLTVIEFLPTSRAEKILLDRISQHPKAKLIFNHQITEIVGDEAVTGVKAIDRATGEEKVFPAQGVFIYVGYKPATEFVADLVERNKWGYIITDEHMRTKVAGLYAIGDVRANNPAQLSISVGDGAKAALDIREFIQHL